MRCWRETGLARTCTPSTWDVKGVVARGRYACPRAPASLIDEVATALAFVMVLVGRLVRLGVLTPARRALFREVQPRRLAHTGRDTDALVPVALLSVVIGGAPVALAVRPRRRET